MAINYSASLLSRETSKHTASAYLAVMGGLN